VIFVFVLPVIILFTEKVNIIMVIIVAITKCYK